MVRKLVCILLLYIASVALGLILLTCLYANEDMHEQYLERRTLTLAVDISHHNFTTNASKESKSNETCPKSFFKELSPELKHLRDLSNSRSVRFNLDSKKVYNETVVIMSPISNAEGYLPRYFNTLCRLTYPHHLISIALGEDSSRDNTYKVANDSLHKLEKHFARVSLLTRRESLPFEKNKHKREFQLTRRTHLAKSRNSLLSHGLKDETWVLWIDSDVQYIPPDIIEQLLAAGKDIVVPSCMYAAGRKVDIYDRNTWKETDAARRFLKDKESDFLMLQGYGPSMRSFLHEMKKHGNVVEVDGVGGCVLLIKAHIHRRGLVFPPYVYKHHIETEGLAKMAQNMGFKLHGLPNIEVFH